MLKYFIGTKVPIFLPTKREHFNRNTFAANIRAKRELLHSALVIQRTLVQYTHQNKTVHSRSYLFFSDRAIGADMSLVKLSVVRRWPQKAQHNSPVVSQQFP